MRIAVLTLPIVAACVASPVARATPFDSYDCDVMRFTLTSESYTIDGQSRAVARIDHTNTGVTVTLADGYRFALSNIVPDGADWFSFASGDSFRCARL